MSNKEKGSCPCEWTTPCDPDCSCINPVMSRGCDRCCRYGSDLQRKYAAEYIVKQRKYELIGTTKDGVIIDDYNEPLEIKDGTHVYITRWTQEDIDAAEKCRKEIWPEFDD